MERFKGLIFLGGGLLVGIVFGMIVLFSGGNSTRVIKPVPPTSGKSVPDFNLTSLDGKTVRLSDLKGGPVVINFWATWCPPCREEMPLLDQASKQLAGRVVFLAVDDNEDAAVVRDYIDKYALDLTVLLDPDGTINQLYYVQSYPNTFFVDSDGILRAQRIGQLDEAILERDLKAVGITR